MRLSADWCTTRGTLAPHAVTVDHGLREDSAAEAEEVANWAKSAGVPHTILKWESERKLSNLQSQARDARYGLIGDWMKALGLSQLLTGHTQDDQAETLLIRLTRGSGLEGLSGMSTRARFPTSQHRDLTLLRPLLSFPHKRLVATLQACGQTWFEDPGNSNPKFQRTKMRALAPVLSDVGIPPEKLSGAMAHLRRANDYIRAQSAEFVRHAVTFEAWGYALLSTVAFREVHAEIGLRTLARLLQVVGGSAYPPEFDSVRDLLEWLVKDANPRGRTLGGCRLARREPGTVLLAREEELLLAEAPMVGLVSRQSTVWDRRFEISLTEKSFEGSLEVRALGLEGLQQIPKGLASPTVEPGRVGRSLPGIWQGQQLVCAPLQKFHRGVKADARFLGAF